MKPSRLAFAASPSARLQSRDGVTPKSSASFQSRFCFVSSSSKKPRALPAWRRIAAFSAVGSAKKARICASHRAVTPASTPWFTTWKKPHSSHADATSEATAASLPERSMTGTSRVAVE